MNGAGGASGSAHAAAQRGGGRQSQFQSQSQSRRQWVELSGAVEQGVVASVKDGKYAFITCADRDGPELFFHLSDLTDPSAGIQRGDEVSFVVCCDSDGGGDRDGQQQQQQAVRYFAKRLTRLPPGTVSFERVDERSVRGVVDTELKKSSGRGQRAAEAYGGRIRTLTASHTADGDSDSAGSSAGGGGSRSFEFAERDLLDWPCLPALGDEVSFDVFTEKRSGRQGATAVRLVHFNPASRQRGTVSVLKEGYGFIRPEDGAGGQRELFFHFSALLDSTHQPALADELEFDLQRDEQQGRLSAQRISLLPRGSIARDSVPADKLVGVLERDLQAADAPPPSSSDHNGSSTAVPSSAGSVRRSAIRHWPASPSSLPLSPTDVASGESELFEFTSADCRDARPILLKGDTVSFQLLTSGKSGLKRPVNVTLLHASTSEREQGKVVSVNAQGGFAFIRRTQREGELFMHASNYKQAQSDGGGESSGSFSSNSGGAPFVAEGTEVEFSVWLADNNRLCAVRGVPLPPGTVSFERLLEGRYRGVVSREARRREKGRGAGFERQRSGGEQAAAQDERGEIRISGAVDERSDEPAPFPAGTSPFAVSFSASSCPQPLLAGDVVECRVGVHHRSGVHSARDVTLWQLRSSPAQECGVVQQLPGANGRQGRVACQHSAAVLPFDTQHFLRASEAEQLAVGSSVQFDCVELPSESRRSSAGGSGGKERRVAARLSLLPSGSVQLEAVDRSIVFRGRVEGIPSNPKSNKQTAGHIVVLSSHSQASNSSYQSADRPSGDSANGADIGVQAPAAEMDTATAAPSGTMTHLPAAASSTPLSVASLSLSDSSSRGSASSSSSPSVDALLGFVVEFSFRDIVGNAFLAKGDPVEFFAVPAKSGVRAAEVSLLPLQATVALLPTQPNAADGSGSGGGGSGGKSSKSTLGHLSILPVSTATATAASAPSPTSLNSSTAASAVSSLPSPTSSSSPLSTATATSAASSSPSASVPPSSSTYLDESVLYSSSDVVGGFILSVGDVVSIGGMHFNYERKRRQARLIRLVKAAPKVSLKPGGAQQQALSERRAKRASAVAAAVASGVGGDYAAVPPVAVMNMRFARGPDDTRGFASRRGAGQQGVSVGLQRNSSSANSGGGTTSAAAPSNSGAEAHEPAAAAASADTVG